jgi:PAS domain S-box-containing protein
MSTTGHLSELESLRSQVADLARALAERDQALQAQQQGIDGELQDLRKQSDLLRAIMEGTAADTGDDFFVSLATHLTSTLHMQYAVIGEVLEGTPAKLRTVAVASGGTLLDNFEYALAQAPCGTGLTESFWCFEQGVQTLFPNFPQLAAMGVESHSGVSIRDKQGKVAGLIVVMDTKPIADQERLQALLRVFAPRVAAELQRTHAEAALQEQTRRLAHALALAHLGSWDWDIESGDVQWSDDQYRIFGHEPGAIAVTYDTFLAALLPDDHDRVLATINDALLGKSSLDIECRIVRPNGEIRVIQVRADVHRDATQHPLRMVGTALDMTERKQAEEALRASEERWHLAVRGSSDGIWDWNIQSGDIFFSSRWKAMRGFADHDLGNHIDEWRSRIHPDDLDRVLHSIDAYLAKQAQEFCEEYRVQRKDGSYMWILGRGVALWDEDGTPIRMVGSESDISERKRSEEALRQSEARFAAFMAHMPGVAFMKDAAGRHIYVNEGFERLLGISNKDWHLKTNEELFPPEVADRFTRNDQMLARQEQPVEVTETTINGNETRSWLVKKFLVTYEPNSAALLGGIAIDITDRKRAEEALCASEARYRMLVDMSPSGIFVYCEGKTVYVNHAACRILGAESPEQILQQPTLHFVHPDYHAAILESARTLLPSGEPVRRTERKYLTLDRTVIDVEVEAAPITWKGKPAIQGIFSDITERKQAEALLQAQKQVLEVVASGAPLRETLDTLVRLIETQSDGMLGSILLLDEKGLHLRHGASPSLPDEYTGAIDGAAIGPSAGSCGTAAFRREMVIVEDIAADPLWENYRHLALPHGLRACWSTPILSKHTSVWGTFAMYYREPRRPSPHDLQIIEHATRLAAIAIERKRAEDEQKRLLTELAESQKHFEHIFRWTPSAVAISTLAEGRFLDVNDRLVQLTGYSREELVGHTTTELQLWADPPERTRVIQEILQQRSLHNKEGLLRTKSGDVRAIMVSVDRIQVKGTPCLIYVAHDITERKQAETTQTRQYEALQAMFRMVVALARASSLEELYEQGIDGVQRALKVDRASILLFDDDGVMRFKAVRGLSEQYTKAVEGHSSWSCKAVNPSPMCVADVAEDPSVEAYRGIFLAERIRALGFIPLVSSDELLGKFMLYYDRPHHFTEEEIQIAQTIAGTIASMIQRKRAEEAQTASERQLRSVLDTLPIGVWFTDRAGTSLLANPAAKQIWSNIKQVGLRTPDNPSGWWETLERADAPHRWALSHVLTTGAALHNETLDLECLDGTRKTIRNTTVPVQDEAGVVVGAIVLNEDVTTLREAQEALQLTQFSVDHAVEGFFWIGPDARILNVNDAACRMLEYSRDELMAMTVHDIDPYFPPELWSAHWEELKQKGSLTIESKQWSKTGRVLDMEITVSYLRYADREYHCAIMRDIGERKKAQHALRESEDRLQRAIEASGAGTWRVDFRTGLDTRDAGLNRLLGLPAETTVQPVDEWFTFLHPDDRSAMEAAWESASIGGLYEVEHRLIRSDGAIRWVCDRGRFVRDEVGQPLYATGAVIDITERKRVEETLRQREDDLRAALAERERISEDLHDGILQSLYAVGLGLEACKSLQQSKKAAKAIAQALDQAVGQLNAVMGEVRNFIAGLDSEVVPGGNFSTALHTMVQTLTTAHPIQCQVTLDDTALRRTTTDQALHLMNVVREALSNSIRHGQATKARISLKSLRHSIRLSISDNGLGFNPRSMQGVGHGLKNMSARAQKLGGRFTLRSSPRRGTSITVDLPKEDDYANIKAEDGSLAPRR